MASYQKSSNGLWSVRFRIIENHKEVNKRLSGYNKKKDAEKAYLDYMSAYKPPDYVIGNDPTVRELLLQYLQYMKSELKESTLVDINGAFKNYILPCFGDKKLSSITKLQLREWQQSLNNLSYNYKVKIRRYFITVWKFGFDADTCPCLLQDIKGFKQPPIKKEMLYWTVEEFKQFIDTIDIDTSDTDNNYYKTLFSFLYLTGVRVGELRAITKEDIHLETEAPYVEISKTISRKVFRENREKGIKYNLTHPKTLSAYRKIPLPDNLVKMLKDFKGGDNFYFSKKKNTPVTEMTIYRALEYYCEKSGVKKIRVHDFRHSHATLLINNNVNIYVVAARLGHKDVKETFNIYGHLYKSTEINALKQLNFKL